MTSRTLPMNASLMQIVLEFWNMEDIVSHMIKPNNIYITRYLSKIFIHKILSLDFPSTFRTHQNHVYELDVMLMVS